MEISNNSNVSTIILFVICVILSVKDLEANLRVKRILGGNNVEDGKYTYQISLQDSGVHICGAGILNDQFIITAAHCITNQKGEFSGQRMTAVIGTINIKKPSAHTLYIKVSKYFIPKEYNPADDSPIGDIAVIKLKSAIGLKKNSKFTSKLTLPQEPFSLYTGEAATTIAGFGLNKVFVEKDPVTNQLFETGESFGIMRYLPEKVLDNEECNKILPLKVLPNHLCARAIRKSLKPEGVCSGDSGGPLVLLGKEVIGVLVAGPTGCKEIRSAGRYTRVTSYVSFIKMALQEVEDATIREAEWIKLDSNEPEVLIVK